MMGDLYSVVPIYPAPKTVLIDWNPEKKASGIQSSKLEENMPTLMYASRYHVIKNWIRKNNTKTFLSLGIHS